MSESPHSTAEAPAAAAATPAPAPTGDGHEYKVNLDVYSGPLELLLYLIRRDEVDIKNIPIARITEQYLRHVEIIRKIDINLAGEFLVMAATLMEIKSRMLIPKQPQAADPNDPNAGPTSVEEIADPRYELVKQLLAYKEFKDAATDLKRRAQTEAARYPRATPKPEGRAPLAIEDLDLFRLIDAFNAIMSSLGQSAYGHEVLYDDTPISLHQADILDRLTREPSQSLTLQELFQGRTKKSEMIGLFLATLELIRQKKVTISQPETLGPIQILLRTDVPDQQLFTEEEPSSPTNVEAASSEPPPTEASSPQPTPELEEELPPEE
ncbi:MAG TPA: segregation/condensation protein A [Phycisphaerae bacterium]|nr:segregation/condensation protein A [Phycisphaerae bacterium]